MTGFLGDYLLLGVAERIANRLFSRETDDAGFWEDEATGRAFTHRLVSIFELSLAGSQLLVSPCGMYVRVSNGEIYNHQELRLKRDSDWIGCSWRDPIWA